MTTSATEQSRTMIVVTGLVPVIHVFDGSNV
jgi:hypothetical protein